jgi:hypothetical protein
MLNSNPYKFYRVEAHRNARPTDITEIPDTNTAVQPLGNDRYLVHGWFKNKEEVIRWWEDYFSAPPDLGIEVNETIETKDHFGG